MRAKKASSAKKLCAGHADAGTAAALDAFMRAADALAYDEEPDYDALEALLLGGMGGGAARRTFTERSRTL